MNGHVHGMGYPIEIKLPKVPPSDGFLGFQTKHRDERVRRSPSRTPLTSPPDRAWWSVGWIRPSWVSERASSHVFR
jgi:hypothetical protein